MTEQTSDKKCLYCGESHDVDISCQQMFAAHASPFVRLNQTNPTPRPSPPTSGETPRPGKPLPQWVTSWPDWFGIFGNVTVIPKEDYDRLERELAEANKRAEIWAARAAGNEIAQLSATDAADARRYHFLQRITCGNTAGGKGSDKECYLSLNPSDMDAAIDSNLNPSTDDGSKT